MLADPPALCRRPGADIPTGVGIASKVRFLSRPDSYPERPLRVDVIETHYSWVFLTGAHAYKLKKPVRGEGFDFSTVAARRRNALTEICLNRRLAPDVYLGLVPLTVCTGGRLAIGGNGAAVDWLVKMVRLESGRMLDRRLALRAWRRGDIEPIGRHLAGFFAAARPVRVAPPKFSAQFVAELTATARAVTAARDPRLLSALSPVGRRLAAFLVRRADIFRRRIRDRRLVDGHGDLRPEHIYVDGTPRVIDCLEFRADLRCVDPVSELAYLALECRRLGGPSIGGHLLRRYRARTGDRPPGELVRFYTAFNAVARARIAIQHLAEPGNRKPAEWLNRAAVYLAIAARESRFLIRRASAAGRG